MGIDPVSLAITLALNAASMAITASRTIEGPRLSDLKVSVADYGTPVASFVGKSRIECPCFYAEPIREEKHKSKGKSGKYKYYDYYGTWASLVADNAVDRYNTLYFDHHIVYDDQSGWTAFEGDSISDDMAEFFYGSEDQDAPDRMISFVEADEGAETCPNYLGLSYIFFQDIPLGNLGNRYPQVSAIATAQAINDERYEIYSTFSGDSRLWNVTLSQDGKKLYMLKPGGGYPEVWDLATKTRLYAGTVSLNANPQVVMGIYSDGSFLYLDGNTLKLVSADLSSVSTVQSLAHDMRDVRVLKDGAGVEHWIALPYSSTAWYYLDGTAIAYGAAFSGFNPKTAFVDHWGDVWIGARESDTSAKFTRVVNVSGRAASSVVASGLSSGGGPFIQYGMDACHYRDANRDQIVFWWANSHFYIVDIATGNVTESATASPDIWSTANCFAQSKPGANSIWVNSESTSVHTAIQYSLKDLSLLQTRDLTDWVTDGANAVVYSPFLDALVCFPSSTSMTWRYFHYYLGTNVTLEYLMNLIAAKVGMDSGDYDFSDLTQDIYGYSWIQGPAKDIVAPVLDIHDSIVRLSGFTLEGLRRGKATSGDALTYSWFVRGGDPLYTVRNIGDSDLPRRITVTYADLNAELQPNSAVASRNGDNVETVREISIDLTTMSLDSDNAQPLLERFLRRNWMGATQCSMSLTPKELLADPGDVRDITIEDSITIRSLLVSVTRQANRVMKTRWEQEDARPAAGEDPAPTVNAIIASPGAEAIGRPPPAKIKIVSSEGFFLDIPLAIDSDDQTVPFIYIGAGPTTEDGGWPGADAAHSDTGASYASGFYTFTDPASDAVWGDCVSTLPDALASVIDEGSELIVNIKNGTLASVAQDDLDASDTLNLAVVGSNANGWEIIQYRDATLQSADGNWRQYSLEGIYRGRRGTEQFTGTHAAGDRILLLTNVVARIDLGANEIGDTDYYKMTSIGFDPDNSAAQSVAFAGNSHRPYAPANITLHQDGATLDWQIGWDARSRIGGNNIDGVDVPVGESSELYRVKIMDGATEVREIDATSQSATYTAAQQIADWGSVQSGLSVDIVQVAPDLNLEGFTASAAA